MNRAEVLYVKGMNTSETEEDDAWDDRKLNTAYDIAVNMANIEVAKRMAMSTNSIKEVKPQLKKEKSKKKQSWKAGMGCRAVYEEDGLEYEAVLERVLNGKECIVKFLGYGNSEVLEISSLKPSRGKRECYKQIMQATSEKADNGFGSQASIDMEYASERALSPGTTDKSEKRSSKKKKHNHSRNSKPFKFELPDMSAFQNLCPMDMPIPPPPTTMLTANRISSENQVLTSMLHSWYMSGYYTGLYQGKKRSQEHVRTSTTD